MSQTHTGPHRHAHGENPWAGQGSVLLDIGGDVGALVVTMPEGLEGHEVEIRPASYDAPEHAHEHRPHVAVVRRPAGAVRIPSLVFPELTTGSYELYEKGTDDVRLLADVVGGRVAYATWPA